MARDRLEDLGRLYVMLENILELDLFQKMDTIRCKDFVDWFRQLEQEKQDDLLHDIAYGISNISSKIADCLFIAEGNEE